MVVSLPGILVGGLASVGCHGNEPMLCPGVNSDVSQSEKVGACLLHNLAARWFHMICCYTVSNSPHPRLVNVDTPSQCFMAHTVFLQPAFRYARRFDACVIDRAHAPIIPRTVNVDTPQPMFMVHSMLSRSIFTHIGAFDSCVID